MINLASIFWIWILFCVLTTHLHTLRLNYKPKKCALDSFLCWRWSSQLSRLPPWTTTSALLRSRTWRSDIDHWMTLTANYPKSTLSPWSWSIRPYQLQFSSMLLVLQCHNVVLDLQLSNKIWIVRSISWAYHGTRFQMKNYCVFQFDYGQVSEAPGVGGMNYIENSALELDAFVKKG